MGARVDAACPVAGARLGDAASARRDPVARDGMPRSPVARDGASASRATATHHSLPELWKHAMKHYGRYQGYAWTTMLAAGGLAYAISVTMPKQTSTRIDDGAERDGER